MHTKLGVFVVFSLIIFMIVPAYANVTSVSLEKSYYTNEEKMVFIGKEEEGKKTVVVIIRDSSGVFKGMLSDFLSESDGTFSTTPTEKSLTKFFDSKGTYNATAFTNEQKEENGITIKLQYDGNKVLVVPDFALALNSIPDKTIEEEKTLEFTPTLTESLTGVIFSLEKNPPTGSSINNETGKFTWTPEASQGPASYVFDIVVKKGALEDRENIMITVTEPVPVTQPEPTPVTEPEPISEPTPVTESKELGIASFVDPTKDPQSYIDRYNNEPKYKEWFDKTYPEYSSIYQAVGLGGSKVIASFVDPTKDPQSYINRYNNEPKYKEWFDKTYPEYSSIYQAVGLGGSKAIASFVDPTKDPQSYINRYNNEPKYKEWFDKTYPEYSSIYQAVGLEKPLEVPAPFVDPTLDPQFYINRYNNEPKFKEWFDKTYPEYSSIYQAVGVDESKIKEQESGQCGSGTILVDGICTPESKEEGGGCLIATAAYGSELAPQVQQLRELRDNSLLQTESGTSFMNTFNQFYYSFSPTIADWERENPIFKEMVKITLTPMISSLSILNYVDMDSEESVLGYGISLILLNVGMYFVAPAMLFYSIKKAKTQLSF